MGGRTINTDPLVIATEERNRARVALENRIVLMHRTGYPYQTPPPWPSQIDATISAISALLRDPDIRPIVFAALGVEQDSRLEREPL